MSLSRRKFIERIYKYAAYLLMINNGMREGFCSVKDESAPSDFFITSHDVGKGKFTVAFLDNKNGRIAEIPFPYFVHHFLVTPDPNVVLCLEKHGQNLVLLDVKGRRILKKVQCEANRLFNGHGVYSSDQQFIFTSTKLIKDQKDLGEGAGIISVYNSRNLMKEEEFPSHGFYPHDCCLIDNKRKILILNSNVDITPTNKYEKKGNKANCSILDAANGRLLEILHTKEENVSFSHLARRSDDFVALVGGAVLDNTDVTNPKSVMGEVYILDNSLTLNRVDIKTPSKGFYISVEQSDDHGIIGATSTIDNSISFCDFKTMKLIKKLNIPRVIGLALSKDKKFFVASSSDFLYYISIPGLEVAKKTAYSIFSSPHLTNLAG